MTTTTNLQWGQSWISLHKVVDPAAGVIVLTEALELPHGCLVRTTTIQKTWLGRRISSTLVFVPNLKLELTGTTVGLKHSL